MFDIQGLNAARRNHALEHAAVTVLLEKSGFRRRLAGRSTAKGFYILGNVSTRELEEAVEEGLNRLKRGESDLAISPFCGTNLAVAGILAALSVTIALGSKNRLTRLPNAMLAGMLAVMVAQPLGALVQKYVTTSPDLYNVRVVGITSKGWGPLTVHKVETVALS